MTNCQRNLHLIYKTLAWETSGRRLLPQTCRFQRLGNMLSSCHVPAMKDTPKKHYLISNSVLFIYFLLFTSRNFFSLSSCNSLIYLLAGVMFTLLLEKKPHYLDFTLELEFKPYNYIHFELQWSMYCMSCNRCLFPTTKQIWLANTEHKSLLNT